MIESPVLKHNQQKCAAFQQFVKVIGRMISVDMKSELESTTIHYAPKVLNHTKLIGLLEKTWDFDHFQAKTPGDYLEEPIKGIAKLSLNAALDELKE